MSCHLLYHLGELHFVHLHSLPTPALLSGYFTTSPTPSSAEEATAVPSALPPYPSSAVKILHNITNTILC
jgi:hypothetical protein